MRKLDARSHTAMPWKNGGGTTIEIARWPAESSLDTFDWRVSVAKMSAPGPFSRFDGVDRTIAMVDGPGMTLAIPGRGDVALDSRSAPFAFPGDIEVQASLVGGEVLDFNAMTRRGRWRHCVIRVRVDRPLRVAPLGEAAIVFVVRGELPLGPDRAGPHDAIILDENESIDLEPDALAELLIVDLWRT